MSTALVDLIRDLPGPAWLRDRRAAAAQRCADTPLPTDAEEDWRYSRIGSLRLEEFGTVPAATADGSAPGEGIVVVDGRVVRATIPPSAIAAGVTVRTGDAVRADDLGQLVADDADAFVLRAVACTVEPIVIDVPAGAVVADPLHIDQHVTADGATLGVRVVVRLGANASLAVIDRSRSGDVASLVLPVIELDLGEGAQLRYVQVQELGPRMWQIGVQSSRTGRDATLRSMAVALGGSYARVRNDARIAGRGGHNELLAVYFGEGDQMHDFRTLQEHGAPSTTSDLVFKGAVEDASASVYTGLIRIGRDGRGSVAHQTNRNLLLSPEASAESVPNLEIEINDVKCSHASAVGPIDDEQRYYLESRGVPPEVAERLIVLGFFADLLDRVPDEALRAQLIEAVTAKLDRRSA